tara:strand:- start:16 stop:219 length:204 start_codon:yes stop_codon:yes gene_type:complete
MFPINKTTSKKFNKVVPALRYSLLRFGAAGVADHFMHAEVRSSILCANHYLGGGMLRIWVYVKYFLF